MFGWKKIWLKKLLNVGQKKCWQKKMWVKKLLAEKIFRSKKMLAEKKFGSKKMWVKKKFGSKKNWVKKNVGQKSFAWNIYLGLSKVAYRKSAFKVIWKWSKYVRTGFLVCGLDFLVKTDNTAYQALVLVWLGCGKIKWKYLVKN